ncbi:MAG: amino acid adenylation domain-containing protein, partial [Lachnospiraceae bacterium]|nr:amino acid adenylation domain-containing protein [Lachnospiraceae bacterium]
LSESRNEFCGLSCEQEELELSEAKAGIEFYVYPVGDKVTCYCNYRKSLYTGDFISGFINVYQQVLKEFTKRESLSDVKLTDEKAEGLLKDFNNTVISDEITDIVTLFRRQVELTPDRTAVIYMDKHYTYRQADEISEKIAVFLKKAGVGKGDVVSVLIPRSEYMALASIGVLKAGAAYQPLDPTYPSDRLEFMIKDADASCLIADRSLTDRVPGYKGRLLCIDEIEALPDAEDDERKTVIEGAPTPGDGFILLYTSGSTGVPKGVALEHANLCNFCNWYIRTFELTSESRSSAYASYGFDCCMMDMYPALITGAAVVVVPEEIRLDLAQVQDYFDENGVTHSFMTTQVARQFAEFYSGNTLKVLIAAGEALAPLAPQDKSFTLYNCYGPSECTILVTHFPVRTLYQARVPIGGPLDNTRFYVVDRQGRLMPPDVPGELWISGLQVGRGYINRPEKNAEVFISNPFSDEADYSRVYRTGDVVRWMRNGSIDFIGRSDGQVKIRGFRIELKEVETVIREFSGVRDATVQAFDAPSGGKYLAAYLVGEGKVDIEDLRLFISERKPAYMVPEAIMQIDSIPLNQNGKVNRKALPEIRSESQGKTETARSVDNVLEAELRKELAHITGNDNISFDEPLTYDGLTSIGFIRLSAFLYNRFNVTVPTEKFRSLSLLGLENEILLALMNKDAGNTSAVKEEAVLEEESDEMTYPISAAQLGIYMECAKNPESKVYNIPAWLEFESRVSPETIEDAIGRILEAHPSLNVHFEAVDDQIMAVPNGDTPFSLSILEMTDDKFVTFKKDYIFTFHLNRGPLYNFTLVQTDSSWLYMDFHHLIFDGYSLNLFLEELGDVLRGGMPHAENASYPAFVREQNELLLNKAADYDEYFAKLFTDLDAPTGIAPDLVSTDRQGQSVVVRTSLNEDIADRISHRTGASQAAVFLATLCYVTARLAGTDNVFISTISSGRGDVRFLGTYGMFVNTLPIASALIPGTVDEYIKKTGEALEAAIAHENYPFAKVADRWGYGVELMYAYQRGLIDDPEIPGVSGIVPVSLDATKFPLFARIVDDEAGAALELVYNDALYSEGLIKNIGRYYGTVLMRFGDDGDAALRKVSLLDEKEEKLLGAFYTVNEEQKVSEDTFFFSGMERHAALHPEKVAVIATDGTYSYGEFDSITDRVANALIKRGASAGGRALVLLPRTTKALFAFFGASKAGLGYIPFDPSYPTERVNMVIEDSDAQFVITTTAMLPRFEGRKAVDIDELLAETDDTKPHVALDKKNISYMIYTSGSTGRPKGVMLSHEGMAHYVADMPGKEMVNTLVNECSVYCSITTLSFDISVMEYSLALSNGITLYLANEAECNDAQLLAQRMIETKTNCISGTPSRIYTLLSSEAFCDALKKYGKLVICGGEKYSEKLMVKLKELVPHPMNIYGPSEITISCNEHDLTGEDLITVGKPTPGVTEYIVDTDGNELPVGVVGEIYIGGWGVGLGYNNLDEQTKEKFISFKGERVYKSGDYGRWRENGYLEIIGRKDNQIKLRGLRIELGEVETVLASFPGMKVVAVKIEKINDIEHLCAWFTNETKVDIRELKEALSKTLTQYMVPTAYMQLDTMPYTPNGKLDLKNLPIPELFRGEGDKARSKAESDFCGIFSELLGVENVLATEDFFELGGTSLLVTQVVIEAGKLGYNIVFGDMFANPTPRKLAQLFEEGCKDDLTNPDSQVEDYDYTKIDELLKRNNLDNFLKGEKRPLGNVLLTGATGYLGTHVLHELLENTDSRVYCLVRSSRDRKSSARLSSYMYFYFDKGYHDLLGDRLFVYEGDVTDRASFDQLDVAGIDTVINCAATVRHFAHDNIIEDINLGGAKNVIDFCLKNNAMMIQTSTMSVIEIGYRNDRTRGFSPNEQVLYFGQDLSNQYVHSKFLAERAVLEAVVERGLKAKILRYGNLSARQSDGEFQMNFESNSAMGRLRAFAALGCASYEAMNRCVEFSPIDMVAKASVLLSSTCDDCMLFHVITDQYISMAYAFDQMNSMGLPVRYVETEEYEKAFEAANNHPRKASLMTSLIAYNKSDGAKERIVLKMDRTYTLQVLYRLGFFWPMISADYISGFLKGLKGLGYFDVTNELI